MSMIDWRPARAARHVRDVEVCLGPAARPAAEQGGGSASAQPQPSAFHYAAWAPDRSSPTGWTLLHASELAPRDAVDGAVTWAPWPTAAAARLPTAAAAARFVHVHVCGTRTCAETMASPPPAPPAPPCGGDRGRCGGGGGSGDDALCLAATIALDAGAPCDAPLTVPGSVAVRLAGVGRVAWVPESDGGKTAATEEAAADTPTPADPPAPPSDDGAPTLPDDPWAAAALTRRAAGGLTAARARAAAAAAALEAAAGDGTQAEALAAAQTQADACDAMAAAAEARASAAREATTALRETTLRRARSLAAAAAALAAADADVRRTRATLLPRARAGAQAAAAALVSRRCALVAGVGAALAIAPTPGDVAARPATGFPWDALDAGWTGGGGSGGAGSRGARSEAGGARARGPPSLAASAPPLAPPTPSASSVTSAGPGGDAAVPPPPRLTIAGLAADAAPAPTADAAAVDAAAAGALAAAVAAIAAVTAVPLRHPLRVCGSTSGARARPPPAGTARARATSDGVGDAVGAALLLPGALPRALLAATGRRGVATPGDDLDPGAAAAAADAAAGAPPEFRLAPFRGADGDRAAADGRRAAYGAFLLYRDVVQLLDAHGLAVPAGGRDAALAGVHKLVAAAAAAER